MTTIGTQDVGADWATLIGRIARGEQVLVTQDGEPVAMLVAPPKPARPAVSPREAIESLKAYSRQQGRTLGGLTAREMVDDGRRY